MNRTYRRRLIASAAVLGLVWAVLVASGLRLAGEMPTPRLEVDSHALAAWTAALAALLSGLQALLIAAIMRAYVSSEHRVSGCLLLIGCAMLFTLLAGVLGSQTPTLNHLMAAAGIGLYFCASFAQWARHYWPATTLSS
ncbi:MAG: hypothetical protein ACT4OM_13360 [Actinomycetota bacterium]